MFPRCAQVKALYVSREKHEGNRGSGERVRLRDGICQKDLVTKKYKDHLRARCSQFLTVLLAFMLSFSFASGAICAPTRAYADEVSDAQAALDEAEARMADITAQYDTLTAEAAELQTRIDETAASAKEAQSAMLEGRSALSKSAVYEYRGGTTSLVLDLIFSSTSFDDLLRNISYLKAIMGYQADEVAAQKQRTEHYNNLLSELNTQKNDYENKLSEIDQKQTEAQSVVESAKASLGDAQEAEAERLAALEAEQARLAAQEEAAQAAAQASINENAETVTRQDVVPDTTPVEPDTTPVDNSDGTWSSGVASAYGGSTDPYVGNPCTTATGDVCDDNSMGVAIPMSWPNYRSYFGRKVEISYNGMTVLATVNDCGGLNGGSRSLDLQPGVWKAFGFSSCNAWGVRTVSYRFL